ncbi:hypothetical protein PISL3812_04006 [Talaromyces islandicus]|uniref:Integral membrane protein n=1 Tax=Talaromyces islandicus TaxID=28573 RepID=A0A0U1LUA1_TALIS|nr:hypothetical protein PISL3812_04006 [Talaromyces islandicus]
MAISQSSFIPFLSTIFAAIGTAFGVNAFIRPEHALSMFEFDYPTSADAKQLVDYLMIVYGVRDIFIGVALLSAVYSGNRKVLGWNLLGFAGAAFADGLVCKMNGHGEWNHWGYGSFVAILGLLSAGGF